MTILQWCAAMLALAVGAVAVVHLVRRERAVDDAPGQPLRRTALGLLLGGLLVALGVALVAVMAVGLHGTLP